MRWILVMLPPGIRNIGAFLALAYLSRARRVERWRDKLVGNSLAVSAFPPSCPVRSFRSSISSTRDIDRHRGDGHPPTCGWRIPTQAAMAGIAVWSGKRVSASFYLHI